MKMLRALATGVALTVMSAGLAWSDTWSGEVTPIRAHAEDYNSGQLIYIVTAEPLVNPANCPDLDGYVLVDQVIAGSTLATALTAIASGQKITVYVSSSTCEQGRPTATIVEMW